MPQCNCDPAAVGQRPGVKQSKIQRLRHRNLKTHHRTFSRTSLEAEKEQTDLGARVENGVQTVGFSS